MVLVGSAYKSENVAKTKAELLGAVRSLLRLGLLSGKEGNLSALTPERLMVITPSRKDYTHLAPEDLVVVDLLGREIEGQRTPSSELRLHIAIYKHRPDVKAIIHTHATYASALAVTRQKLPVIADELIIALGGEIAVSDYAIPGTDELGVNVAIALGTNKAVLIANHGCATVGGSVEDALENMIILERVSKIYVISRIIGSPRSLPIEAISHDETLWSAPSFS